MSADKYPSIFPRQIKAIVYIRGGFKVQVAGYRNRVAGHCFTITETTQTFTKILTIGWNIICEG